MAGFINGSLSPYARSHGQYQAVLPLARAMLLARPRAFEWLRFAFIWGIPMPVRKLMRRLRPRPVRPTLLPEVLPPSQPITAYLPLPAHGASVAHGASAEKTG